MCDIILRQKFFNFSCQEMQRNNINKSVACKELDEKCTAMQSDVDSLNNDIKMLTSE